MSIASPSEGMIVQHSGRTIDDVMARLRQTLASHGLKVFADLDFSADAAAAGLTLAPTRMLIAGNPKAGTLLIQAVPAAAIDLPLKVLVWSDAGSTRVAYNDPGYIARRHGLPADLLGNISGFGVLVEKAAGP